MQGVAMNANEVLTLIALLFGPVIAVTLQLTSERRKHVRDRQVETMRMLVSTRHLPSDPRWTQAINMVPIDFNSVGKVMAAWRSYQSSIRYQASPENLASHQREATAKQTNLIFEILSFLKYDLAESEFQDSAYAASGLILRDNLMLSGWEAWPRIAAALESNNAMLSAALAQNQGNPK